VGGGGFCLTAVGDNYIILSVGWGGVALPPPPNPYGKL